MHPFALAARTLSSLSRGTIDLESFKVRTMFSDSLSCYYWEASSITAERRPGVVVVVVVNDGVVLSPDVGAGARSRKDHGVR